MPEPRYPRFSITPVAAREPGVTIRKLFPMDPGTVEPAARLSLETNARTGRFTAGRRLPKSPIGSAICCG